MQELTAGLNTCRNAAKQRHKNKKSRADYAPYGFPWFPWPWSRAGAVVSFSVRMSMQNLAEGLLAIAGNRPTRCTNCPTSKLLQNDQYTKRIQKHYCRPETGNEPLRSEPGQPGLVR